MLEFALHVLPLIHILYLKLSINTFKEPDVRISAGSLFETLILLKFIDIYDFLMLRFGAMNLLPNQKFIVGPSLISAFFYWDPFINDVDYRL